MSRRFRLNPCDYMFLSHHRMMESLGQVGNRPMMEMDVEGFVDPRRFKQAVQRTFAAHPVARAGLRFALRDGRPRWVVRREPAESAERAFTFFDYRERTDWPACAEALRAERYALSGDLFEGPQAHVDYCAGPHGLGRVFLRWPHALMDAEGAQWFLAEISRLDAPDTGELPKELRPDGEALDVLAGRSWRARLKLFRRGLGSRGEHGKVLRQGVCVPAAPETVRACVRQRVFEAPDVARIEAHARETCPGGPGIYSRYLAGCVIRALHRLYVARGLEVDSYLVTLPMSVRPPGPRPVHGNYLVAATLSGRRERVGDARALAADLAEQLRRFRDEDLAVANWALMWAAGFMRAWQYRIMLRLPIGLEPYASGFSYYGEIDPPLREFLGARVTNLWGTGPLSAPPGWNPLFCRFGQRMNFTITWLSGCIPDGLAEEFALEIEREALEGPDAGPRPA